MSDRHSTAARALRALVEKLRTSRGTLSELLDIDGQVEPVARQLELPRPDAPPAGSDFQHQGWTYIPYLIMSGERVPMGTPSWDDRLDRLIALAKAIESERSPGSAGQGVAPAPSPPADGTVEGPNVWLRGACYRLTIGLAELLGYLLTHSGASEDDVSHHCGYRNSSHLHKRLKDLRDRLPSLRKKGMPDISIKTEATCVYCSIQDSK
jgi:hypothetical protein